MVHIDPNSFAGKFIVFIGLPIWVAVLYFHLPNIRNNYASPNWPHVSGTIESATMSTYSNGHGTSASPKIVYTYQIGKVKFRNTNIEFSFYTDWLTWNYTHSKLNKYPVGAKSEIFYNPSDSDVSCLEPGTFHWADYFMLLVECSGIYFGVKQWLAALRGLKRYVRGDNFAMKPA